MLPSFVAANLQRVPSVAPGDVDVYVMAATVAALSSQLESLSKKVDSMAVCERHLWRSHGTARARG
jgi:phage I-like protein